MDEQKQAGNLRRALEEMCGSGPVEVYEDGRLLAGLSKFRFDVREEANRTLLHLWSEESSLVRRVLRVTECSDGRLSIEVQRFGKAKPGRLELVSVERARPEARLSREKFRERFRQLLMESFPDEEIETLTAAPDLEHSFSGNYVRGIQRRGRRAWVVMGASWGENSATIDGILSYGLVWLDWQREHARSVTIAGLRLFLPAGACQVTAHRCLALASSTAIELYEVDENSWRPRLMDPRDAGNLATWLTPRREVERTLQAAEEDVKRIRSLAPEAIDAVVPPGTREVSVRFRGLEFARGHSGKLFYGLPGERRALLRQDWKPLNRLVKDLAAHRSPAAKDQFHPLYRGQAERWLETMILAEPQRLDAHLDPAYLYSQVPAFSAGDRGVIDLLGVTRDRRLAVIELKVSEDIHLAMQAVDYWLRVRWHQQQDDFRRYGYFGGIELQERPPLLYLVAPGFRFHPATDVILRSLGDQIEVVRVGINEGWRSGIQVVFRDQKE